MKFTLTVIAVLLSGLLIHVTDTTVIIAFRVLINLPPGRSPQLATILVADKLRTAFDIDIGELQKKHVGDPMGFVKELDNHAICQEEINGTKVMRVKDTAIAFIGEEYAYQKIAFCKRELEAQADTLTYIGKALYSRKMNRPIDTDVIAVQPGLDYLTTLRCVSVNDCKKRNLTYPAVFGFGKEFIRDWLRKKISNDPISLDVVKWKLKEVFSELIKFQQQFGVLSSSQNHAGYVIMKDGSMLDIDENNMPLNYNDIMSKRKARLRSSHLAVPVRPSSPRDPQPSTSRADPSGSPRRVEPTESSGPPTKKRRPPSLRVMEGPGIKFSSKAGIPAIFSLGERGRGRHETLKSKYFAYELVR